MKVIAPVVIEEKDGKISLRNRNDFADTSAYEFTWRLETEGEVVANGVLDVPVIKAGETVTVDIPSAQPGAGESFWFISVKLAKGSSWAAAGHEVAWGQLQATPAPAVTTAGAKLAPNVKDGRITLGPGTFDAEDGSLLSIGGVEVTGGARLQVWRAQTDNDRIFDTRFLDGTPGGAWRRAGLDRIKYAVDGVDVSLDALVVRIRAGAASHDRVLAATYIWTADANGLHLALGVDPLGDWSGLVLPRLGVVLGLPGSLVDTEWFGAGPGEAYPDTCKAAWVGKHALSINAMQTPYVYPQENGSRMDTRWARLTGSGAGIAVANDGGDPFALTARRWTTAQLEAARHTDELTPGPNVWLDLDVRHNGMGTLACGPGVLPQHQFKPEHAELKVVFSEIAK
jgi:beta-galactosidase